MDSEHQQNLVPSCWRWNMGWQYAPKKSPVHIRFLTKSGIKWWIGICHIIHPMFLDKPCGWLRLGQRLMLCRSALILCLTERERSNGNITWIEYLVGGLEHDLFFHILGMSSSQLTSSYFSEGWLNHQPDMLESLGNTTGFPMRIFPETIPMTRSLQAICSHVDPSLGFVNGLTLTIWDYGGGS